MRGRWVAKRLLRASSCYILSVLRTKPMERTSNENTDLSKKDICIFKSIDRTLSDDVQ